MPRIAIMPNDKRLLIGLSQSVRSDFVGDAGVARLRQAYGDVVVASPDDFESADAWRARLLAGRPDAILSGWGTPSIPPDAMPPLAIVAHAAGSVRGLVTREMIERGLIVTNWGAAAAPAVAECALLLMLASLRRLNAWSFVLHGQRGWSNDAPGLDGLGLYGRRVGIHGFGHVARHLVRLLAPFGCRVWAYSVGVPSSLLADHGVAEAASLAALFATSDVLVEAEALNASTRGSVTEALLRSLPDGACFVNVGRGAVVDERALERVAGEGRLQVALDVFEREPLPAASPLRGLPNVTLLPHLAGPTRDQRRACGRRAVDALCRHADGEVIAWAIGVDEYDRST